MEHKSEFFPTPAKKDNRETAKAYTRLFSSDDGKRVLADLRAKYGLHRLCFTVGTSFPLDPLRAAIIDGQRSVMSEIESAIEAGQPR